LLVFWAYQQNQSFLGRGLLFSPFFSRVSAKNFLGVFSVFFVFFVRLGGLFVFWGIFFFFFARQRVFLGGSFFSKAHHTETGNSRSGRSQVLMISGPRAFVLRKRQIHLEWCGWRLC